MSETNPHGDQAERLREIAAASVQQVNDNDAQLAANRHRADYLADVRNDPYLNHERRLEQERQNMLQKIENHKRRAVVKSGGQVVDGSDLVVYHYASSTRFDRSCLADLNRRSPSTATCNLQSEPSKNRHLDSIFATQFPSTAVVAELSQPLWHQLQSQSCVVLRP